MLPRNPDPARLRALIAELKADRKAMRRRIAELERAQAGSGPPAERGMAGVWILVAAVAGLLAGYLAGMWFPWTGSVAWPRLLPQPAPGEPAPAADTWLPIRRGGRWGFAYPNGETVLKPQFDEVTYFHEGRAGARTRDRWGFIDSTGRFVVEPTYDEVALFSEGRARVVEDGRHGFVDLRGRRVIEPRYADATGFQEGLAAVLDARGYGYIDPGGSFAFEARFPEAYPFSDGLAIVHLPSPRSRADRERAFLTRQGELVRGPAASGRDFVDAWRYSDGLAAVQVRGTRKWGFVRGDGSFAIAPTFDGVNQFSEGRAAFIEDGRYGYIDTSGRVAIPPRYDEAGQFSEGLARVRLGTDVFFIDPAGGRLDTPAFSDAEPFREGRARVLLGGRMAYIDSTGAFVWGPE